MHKDNKNEGLGGYGPLTDEAMASPQYLKYMAKIIGQMSSGDAARKPVPDFNVSYIARGAEIHDRFKSEVVLEENFNDCISAMAAISQELEEAPELAFYAKPHKMLELLESYLVSNLYISAQQPGGLPDHLSLKAHLLQAIINDFIDGGHNRFFSDPNSIINAVKSYNNDLLQEPVRDSGMFEFLLGRDGADAFEVVFSNDIQAIKKSLANLSKSKNLEFVIKIMAEQLALLLVFELAVHAAKRTPVPGLLAMKMRMYLKLKSVKGIVRARRFFKADSISEILSGMQGDQSEGL